MSPTFRFLHAPSRVFSFGLIATVHDLPLILSLELSDMSVIFLDVLENLVGKFHVVLNSHITFGLGKGHISNGSLNQELLQILLLQFEIFLWLFGVLFVGRDLVESSTHHTSDYCFLEFVDGFRVGSDVLKADELSNQHILNTFDVLHDIQINTCAKWMLLNVDRSKEYGLKLGLKL